MTGKEYGNFRKEKYVGWIIVFSSRACQGKDERAWSTVESVFPDHFIHFFHLLNPWKCNKSLWNDSGVQETYFLVLQDIYFNFWNTENRLNSLINSFTRSGFSKTYQALSCTLFLSIPCSFLVCPFSCWSSCIAVAIALLCSGAYLASVPRI